MYLLQNENVLFYLTYRSHVPFGVLLFCFVFYEGVYSEKVCAHKSVWAHVSEQATVPFSLPHENHRS